MSIVSANICKMDDLLSIKGIGKVKYQKYGQDIFDIIKQGDNYAYN